MKRWRRYAAGVFFAVYIMRISVFAEETGMPAGLSEKIYAEMNVESGVIGNVIKGQTFSILAKELDASGNVWYLVKLSTGTWGYMPSSSVTQVAQMEAGSAQPEGAPQEAEEPDSAQPPSGDGQTADNGKPLNNNNEGLNGDNVSENGDLEPDSSGAAESGKNTVQGVQTIKGVNIRKSTSTKSSVLIQAPPNVTLECLGTVKNQAGEIWYEVVYKDVQGYVKKSVVREVKTPQSQTDTKPIDTKLAGANIQEVNVQETNNQEADGSQANNQAANNQGADNQELGNQEASGIGLSNEIADKEGGTPSFAANTENAADTVDTMEGEPKPEIINGFELYSEAAQESRVLYIDWVLALSLLCALLCTITAFCLLRRVMRIRRIKS